MNDFSPRRPVVGTPQPRPVQTAPQPLSPTIPPRPTERTQPSASPSPHAPVTTDTPFEPPKLTNEPQAPKRRSATGHAGFVGLVVFLILAAALLSALLPGKVVENLPGSSASSSAGGQTLACATDSQNVSSRTAYTTKVGSPLVYKYATSTTLSGTCDGKSQTVVGGTTSEFSPLAAVVNVVIAAVVAFVLAAVWRKVFGSKD